MPRKRASKSKTKINMTVPNVVSQSNLPSAVVSNSNIKGITFSVVPGYTNGIRVNFDCYCPSMIVVYNGVPYFSISAGSRSSYLMVEPDNIALFPASLANIASNFMRYKFSRLTAQYVPRIGTSQQGSFIMGYCPDGNTSSSNTANILGLANCINTAIYQSAILNCSTISSFKEPLYLYNGSVSVTANNRQMYQGALVLPTDLIDGGFSNDQPFGWIKITGIVDLLDVGYSTGLAFTSKASSGDSQVEEKLAEEEKYISVTEIGPPPPLVRNSVQMFKKSL
jgi:hypothetical protein